MPPSISPERATFPPIADRINPIPEVFGLRCFGRSVIPYLVAGAFITTIGAVFYHSLDRNVVRRAIRRAHYVESFEALGGLGDSPFRAARRLGNDPVNLTIMATQINIFRKQADRLADWMEHDNPTLAAVYRRTVEEVRGEVVPLLQEAFEPSELLGPARTASDPRFRPSDRLRAMVRFWKSTTRYAAIPGPLFRVLAWLPFTAPHRLVVLLNRSTSSSDSAASRD